MNRTIAQIKIKDASSALDYYEAKIGLQVIRRYIAKKYGTAKSFQGKLVYGSCILQDIELILTEQEDDRVPPARNIYLVLDDTNKNQKWLEKSFKALKEECRFVFTEPTWNASGTFYGAILDKYDVFWEFKMERKVDE